MMSVYLAIFMLFLLFYRLCDGIDLTNKMDMANFYSSIAGNFEGVVQYNKDNRAFEVD